MKLSYVTLAMTLVAGFHGSVMAQTEMKPSRSAVIDMEYVFKNYKKFGDELEALRGEVAAAEKQMQAHLQQLKTLKQQFDGLKTDSPDYKKKEQELAAKAADLEAARQVLKRDFARKEAALYREVYLEVTDAVQRYAKYYKYNLVMRHSRSELADIGNPQLAMRSMNRQVIYIAPEDDISDAVLEYLNKKYKPASAEKAGE
jgi:Skp family chaperone for outer membrane proteins